MAPTTTAVRVQSCSVCQSTATCCGVCVQTALGDSVAAYQASLQDWTTARHHASIPTVASRLPELQDTSLRLRNEMDVLRKQCSALAVRVCAWQVRNEERRAAMVTAQSTHHAAVPTQLHRLEDAVTGTLEHHIRRQQERNRRMRFQWALTVFWMHRVQVDHRMRPHDPVAGIGKIGGLPLPHVGSELFGVLPPEELQSALRLVAVLTCTVAQCLGIALPHPIVLDGRQQQQSENNATNDDAGVDIASKTSAAPSTTRRRLPREQMISLSTAAVLRESRDRTSQLYALIFSNQDEFITAWQLLQNNTIALSIRAGVPVGKLFPGEAVLLNLHALQEYCQEQTTTATTASTQEEDAPKPDTDESVKKTPQPS